MNAFGRKKILISSASVFGLAGICKASAGGAAALTVGRYLGGMAAGTAAVIVPIYINELAPPNYKGAFGALTQISINLGILSSQVLGVFLEQDGQWRIILLAGGLIGLLQAVGLMFIPESPSFLVAKGDIEQARRALIKIRGTEDVEQELAGFQAQQAGQPEGTDGTEPVGESDPLLEHPNAGLNPEPANREIGLLQFLTKQEYRAGLIIVAGLMLAQQLTGINAVVFYGVSILDELFPDSAKYLNAGISAVNLFVTLVASLLFDVVSHKGLLITSMIAMGTSSAALGLSIFFGLAILSAIATLLFVSAFSMGLGPLPWMVATSRIEPKAVGAAQAIALTANWVGTFMVSFAVPVIASAAGMSTVFGIFTALACCFAFWAWWCL
ncbi:general substrate transporter [Tuber indicum]|nr:general substrate transporter [Tuber indicum]